MRGDPNIAARPEAMALQQATAALEAANAKLDLVKQGATPEQLAVARGHVDAAREQVDAARSRAPAAEAAVQSAMAGLAGAQASLDRLLAGATAEEIAMAEARLQSAQAALASAQARLDLSRIIAPLPGRWHNKPAARRDGNPGQIAIRMGDQARCMSRRPIYLRRMWSACGHTGRGNVRRLARPHLSTITRLRRSAAPNKAARTIPLGSTLRIWTKACVGDDRS